MLIEASYHSAKGYQGTKQFEADTEASAKRQATALAEDKSISIFMWVGRKYWQKLNGRWSEE